jgi:Transposase DDE domain
VTGLIVLPNKSLANMARCILDSADKTNLSRLLSEAPWRQDDVNRRRIRFMLQQTKPHRRRRGESIVAIDDTLCEHVGSLDPDFRARHEQFRTKIALAIELVEEAIRCKVPFGVVVFDAWYLAEDLVRVLARRRKDWISLLKKNRRLETASFHRRDANGWAMKLPGPHIAVEEPIPLIPAPAYRPVLVREQTSWCFTLAVRLPGLGKVRIVVSCERESLTGRSVVLVTNRVDWSAAKIIGLYLPRWPTETFDQDGKGQLGFDAYRMRSTEAIGKHWCLVFVAYSLLHLTCLPAGPDRTKGLMHTIGDACRQQGRALIQRLLLFVHDQLSHGATADHVFAQVFAKQGGMVPV